MGLSVRAYARHRGVSHVAVMKAVRAGRIPQEADGTIDPARADAAWEAQTDPAKRPATVKVPPATPSAPVAPVAATAPAAAGGGSPVDGGKAIGANFAQARTMHEVAKAQKARIQVQRLKDEVIDRANALAMVFKAGPAGAGCLDHLARPGRRPDGG